MHVRVDGNTWLSERLTNTLVKNCIRVFDICLELSVSPCRQEVVCSKAMGEASPPPVFWALAPVIVSIVCKDGLFQL